MGLRHIQACRHLGVNIKAIHDKAPAAVEQANASLGPNSPPAVNSFADLLDIGLDGLIVATTAPSHADLSMAAAESGIGFVMCEKPMATSLRDCGRMIDTCERNGTRLAINHQMRFMEQYVKVREILNSPNFGGLNSVSVVAGNFGMAMNGVHYFELFRWLTSEEVSVVNAWFSSDTVENPRGSQFEDKAGSVRLEVPSGRRFYMEIGADQGHGVTVTYAGRTGIVTTDELNGSIRVSSRRSEDLDLPTTRYGCSPELEEISVARADVVEPSANVLRALMAGVDYPSGEDGRHAMAVLVAAHLSDQNGHIPVSPAEVWDSDLRLPIA